MKGGSIINRLYVGLLVFAIIAALLMALLGLKKDEVIVEARYLLEACEDCDYFEVDRSTDNSLVGVTIIAMSTQVDIEQLINNHLLNKQNVCLKGKPYKFNPNLLGIRPDGIRFLVNKDLQLSDCENLTKLSTRLP